MYTVTVTLTDDDGGADSQSFAVTVINVAPRLSQLSATPIEENGTTTLTGTITDPGILDTFTLAVNWGDPLSPDNTQTVTIGPGATGSQPFTLTHRYLDDNPGGTPQDNYLISIKVFDEDGSHGTGFETGDFSGWDTLGITGIETAALGSGPTAGAFQALLSTEWSTAGDADLEVFLDLAPGSLDGLGNGDATYGSALRRPVSVAAGEAFSFDWNFLTNEDTPGDFNDFAFVSIAGTAGALADTESVFVMSPTTYFEETGFERFRHEFAAAGTFTVGVGVIGVIDAFIDSALLVDNFSLAESLPVLVKNAAPVVDAGADQTVSEGQEVVLQDASFTDRGTLDTHIVTVDWGDGILETVSGVTSAVTGADILTGSFDARHVYADDGLYPVTVTVADDDGGAGFHTITVTVSNAAPALAVVPDQVVDEGSALNLVDMGRFSDPGFANPLNPAGELEETYTFSIDWGDGSAPDSGAATIDLPGSDDAVTQGSFDGSHIYGDDGVYTVTVTLTDDDGCADSQSFTVTVINVAPRLSQLSATPIEENGTTTLTGTITDPGILDTFTLAVNWGDPLSPDNTQTVTIGPGATGSQPFTLTHRYLDDNPGGTPQDIYLISTKLTDDDNGEHSAGFETGDFSGWDTLGITGIETAALGSGPTAGAFQARLSIEGTTAGDTDLEEFLDLAPGSLDNLINGEATFGSALRRPVSVAAGESFSFDWNFLTDEDTPSDFNDFAFVSIAGTASALADTESVFGMSPTAYAEETGFATFQHTFAAAGTFTVGVGVVGVIDALGDSALLVDNFSLAESLPVLVNNAAPVVDAGADRTVSEGQEVVLQDASFTDRGTLDTHIVTVDWGDGIFETVTGVTTGVIGAEMLTGSFDARHVYADDGLYPVTVTVTDDDGTAGTHTITVTVSNVAPALAVVPDQVVDEGSALNFVDMGRFSDPGFANPLNPEGNVDETFTFSIFWGDGTMPDSGPATVDLLGSTGFMTQGSFDGSHVYADDGVYTVTINIEDDDGGAGSQSFQVTVNNVAPVLSVIGEQTIDEGALLTLVDLGSFLDPGFAAPLYGWGNGGETFTFAIDWGDGSTPDGGAATIDLPGRAGAPTQGSFDGGHVYEDDGEYTVTVTVQDDDEGTDTQSFQVTVSNVAPLLSDLSATPIEENGTTVLTGTITDPGTLDTLTLEVNWGDSQSPDNVEQYSLAAGATGFELAHRYLDDNPTATVTDDYAIALRIVDNGGGIDTAEVPVTVNNVAPVVHAQPVGRNALSFDGGDHVDVAHSASLALTGSSTVEVRFKVDPSAAGRAALVQKSIGGLGSNQTYALWVDPSTGRLELETEDAGGVQSWSTAGGLVETGQWYEVASVIDRGTGDVRLFLNGAQVLDDPAAVRSEPALSSNRLVIGRNHGAFGFIGLIDDVAIWKTVRSAAEIAADFASGVDDADTDLAAHWAFSEPDSNRAVDSSTYGNDGVLGASSVNVVGPSVAAEAPASVIRSALAFDGDDRVEVPDRTILVFDGDDRVDVADSPSLALTGSSTVEVRFRFDSSPNIWAALVVKSTNGTNRTYALMVNPSSGRLYMSTRDVESTQYWYLPNGVVQTGQWYELASVIDRAAGEVRIYLNGELVLDRTGGVRRGPAVASNRLQFGHDAGGNGFVGAIDDVAIWNTARSAAEIAADFAAGVDDSDTHLAGHWTFDEPSGNTAFDASTYGNDGVLGGAVGATATPTRDALLLTGSSTVEVRFKVDPAASGWTTLVQKSADGSETNRTYSLWVHQSSGQLFMTTADGTGDQHWFSAAAGLVQAEKWYELASVIDRSAGTVGIYLNGEEVVLDRPAVVRSDPAFVSNLLVFGQSNFVGAIDRIAIWKSARSVVEIMDDFAAGVDDTDTDLVGHWDFDEPRGDVVIDTSGYGNNGVLGGGAATLMPDRVRLGELSFDGSDHLDAAGSESLALTGSSTVEVRFMFGSRSVSWTALIQKSTDGLGLNRTYTLWLNQITGQLQLVTQDASGYQTWKTASGLVQAGQWHELASVIDRSAGDVHIYLNGADLALTGPAAVRSGPALASNRLVIGGPLFGNKGFIGVIDEVVIWNVARSAAEVDADFAGGVDDADTDLAAHWDFDQLPGTVAIDGSGNGNDAVLGASTVNVLGAGVASETPTRVRVGREGELIVLSALYSDAGTADSHSAVIDWGDTTSDVVAMADGIDGAGILTAEHVYADNGVYTITVTLTDDDGGVDADAFVIDVQNATPQVLPGGSQSGEEGQLIELGDVRLFDPGTLDTHSGTIDWDDGSPAEELVIEITPHGPPGAAAGRFGSLRGSHVYADDGIYDVRITVEDDDGGEDTHTLEMTVSNVAPTMSVVADQTVNEGTTLNIVNLGAFFDPGFTNPSNTGGEVEETFTFSIDWGDGKAPDSGAATVDLPGSAGVLTQGSFDGSHVYTDDGLYTVTATVKDDDEGTDTQSFQVTVSNVAPLLSDLSTTPIEESGTTVLTGTIDDPGTSDTLTLEVNWGDPLSPNNVELYPLAAGTASFELVHQYLDDNPTATATDDYAIALRIVDDDDGIETAEALVTVSNAAPVVNPGPDQTVNEGQEAALTGVSFSDIGTLDVHTASVDWGDGTAETVTVDTSGPSSDGPLVGAIDGSHVYADDGWYTVTVTVEDDDGGADTRSFQVAVSNVAPTLSVVADQTVNEGTALNIADLGTFVDPGFANPLNPAGEIEETFNFLIDWGDDKAPDGGPSTVDLPGSAGVLTQGSFDGSHVYADDGMYTVRVTVEDDDGGADTQSFLVTVSNADPVVEPGPDQTVTEGQEVSLAGAGFTDPGTLDTHTVTVDWGDGTVDILNDPATIAANSEAPANGQVLGRGTNLLTFLINGNAVGQISYSSEDTRDHQGPADLVALLNARIAQAGLADQVVAGLDTGSQQLTFSSVAVGSDVSLGVDFDALGDPAVLVGSPLQPLTKFIALRFALRVNGSDFIISDSGDIFGGRSHTPQEIIIGLNQLLPQSVSAFLDQGSIRLTTTARGSSASLLIRSIDSLSIINLGRLGFFNGQRNNGIDPIPDTLGFTPDQNATGADPVPDTPLPGRHVYADNGVYTVTVTAADDDGGADSQSFQVTVTG